MCSALLCTEIKKRLSKARQSDSLPFWESGLHSATQYTLAQQRVSFQCPLQLATGAVPSVYCLSAYRLSIRSEPSLTFYQFAASSVRSDGMVAPATPPVDADNAPSVSVSSLKFAYPDSPPVVDGVTLDLPRGARCLLVGANGAGASAFTVLRPHRLRQKFVKNYTILRCA